MQETMQEEKQAQQEHLEMTDEQIDEQVKQLERILKLRRLQLELSDANARIAINNVQGVRAQIALDDILNPHQGEQQEHNQKQTTKSTEGQPNADGGN